MHPWDAEQQVDAALARRLITAQFPDLAGVPVIALGAGWDNTVFLADGTWAFRFPRRLIALEGLQREVDLLPRLGPLLPLPVPEPELVGAPGPLFPWLFTGARLVPGVELAESGLPDDARAPLAADLGRFLRVLHAPALADRFGAGLPHDRNRRADPSVWRERTLPRLGRLVEAGVLVGITDVAALLDEAAPLGPSPARPVLVHGDLHVRHLLVDPAGRAAGVIDWGDLCLADPSVDLSLAYAGFVGPSRVAFLGAYGHVDKPTEIRARVLAVGLCAALADHAVSLADPAQQRLLTEAVAGIARAVS